MTLSTLVKDKITTFHNLYLESNNDNLISKEANEFFQTEVLPYLHFYPIQDLFYKITLNIREDGVEFIDAPAVSKYPLKLEGDKEMDLLAYLLLGQEVIEREKGYYLMSRTI